MRLLLFLTSASLVLVSCANGDAEDDQVLHLVGQDITEEAYRAHIRQQIVENSSALQAVCVFIREVSQDEALKHFIALSEAAPTPVSLFRGGTPVPNQKADETSARRAVSVTRTECDRGSITRNQGNFKQGVSGNRAAP